MKHESAHISLHSTYPRQTSASVPEDAEYADDTDFLSTDKKYLDQMLPHVEVVFRDKKLIVNADKT